MVRWVVAAVRVLMHRGAGTSSSAEDNTARTHEAREHMTGASNNIGRSGWAYQGRLRH
jgi:hypothetical protein